MKSAAASRPDLPRTADQEQAEGECTACHGEATHRRELPGIRRAEHLCHLPVRIAHLVHAVQQHRDAVQGYTAGDHQSDDFDDANIGLCAWGAKRATSPARNTSGGRYAMPPRRCGETSVRPPLKPIALILMTGSAIAATVSTANTAESTTLSLLADVIGFSCVYVKASPYVDNTMGPKSPRD